MKSFLAKSCFFPKFLVLFQDLLNFFKSAIFLKYEKWLLQFIAFPKKGIIFDCNSQEGASLTGIQNKLLY